MDSDRAISSQFASLAHDLQCGGCQVGDSKRGHRWTASDISDINRTSLCSRLESGASNVLDQTILNLKVMPGKEGIQKGTKPLRTRRIPPFILRHFLPGQVSERISKQTFGGLP
jgi:hypothetical protein